MRSRNGFTLLEMILVLAILVAAAAIAAPALQGVMRNTNLTAGADAVRTEWMRAHVKAMKTGRIQLFRYEHAGNKFVVEPYISDDDELESNGAPATASATPGGAAGPHPSTPRNLPDGITFVGGDSATDSRGAAAEQSAPSGSSPQAAWSSPILFYPDGSSSDAHVVVGNARQMGIRVELRGITGTARVGEIAQTRDLEK